MLYIYIYIYTHKNWYVLCFSVGCLLAGRPTDSPDGPVVPKHVACIYTIYTCVR